ncbi:MAG: DUF2124 domain-containing protein [Methanobacteriota archaeon]
MTNTSYQGIPGILRPFKEYLEAWSLPPGAEVVFYGVPGTCTPFIELLCYAARSLSCSFFFVPYLNEHESRKMIFTEGIGYQIGVPCPISNPSIIVVMGGLAMPGVPVSPEEAETVLSKYPDVARIGVCFMHMFEKANWLDRISFDLLIDATIDVNVITE